MSERSWVRVDRDHLCPVCGRPDWCLIARDDSAALCQRISEGSVRRVGEAGWLHRLGESDGRGHPPPRRIIIPPLGSSSVRAELGDLAGGFRLAVNPARLRWLARDLGVSEESLTRLGIGWCGRSRAWSFPMTDARRNVLGIRLRTELGRKFAVRGGREGLFVPDGLGTDGLLLIAEGPTDTAALLDLGFATIGRPSCRGGRALVLDLVRTWRPASVVIVSDNDAGGQGREGAADLARRLAPAHPRVRVIAPPPGLKDSRAWVRSGANRADVLLAIRDTPPVRVSVGTAPAGGGRHVG